MLWEWFYHVPLPCIQVRAASGQIEGMQTIAIHSIEFEVIAMLCYKEAN